jgi:hypothetical protein
MTREEAATILYKEWQRFLEHNLDYAGISNAYMMAIKTLKQEPCDCISRQAAIDLIADYEFYELNMGQVAKGIRDLPSVAPQPKTGHWIDKFGGEYRCSCCREIISIDTEIDFPNGITYKYCPRCGCRMEGSE